MESWRLCVIPRMLAIFTRFRLNFVSFHSFAARNYDPFPYFAIFFHPCKCIFNGNVRKSSNRTPDSYLDRLWQLIAHMTRFGVRRNWGKLSKQRMVSSIILGFSADKICIENRFTRRMEGIINKIIIEWTSLLYCCVVTDSVTSGRWH